MTFGRVARDTWNPGYNPAKIAEGDVSTISSTIGDRAILPQRIVLTGFMGAGKSTLGDLLARELGWTFVDLDEEIVRAQKKSIADIFASEGEARFRALEHAALAKVLERKKIVLALGGGAIEMDANRQLMEKNRQTLLLYLEAPLHELIERCERQMAEKKAARRPVMENRSELAERFRRRKPLYESAHWTAHTAGRHPEEIVAAVLSRWRDTQWMKSEEHA